MGGVNMGFFNSNLDACYLEEAVLLEDIILPELPPFPRLSDIEAGTAYYPRLEEMYTDQVGKFYIPILTPLATVTDKPNEKLVTNTIRNIVNDDCNLEVTSYTESNYLELTIPKYILFNFLNKIPAGTVFLVGFVGGRTDYEDIKIVGVSRRANADE